MTIELTRRTLLATAAATTATTLLPNEAEADTPGVVLLGAAVIGAMGAVAAAIITASGMVISATITAKGNSGGSTTEKTNDGDSTTRSEGGQVSSGGDGDGDEDGKGTGPAIKKAISRGNLPAKISGYIQRDILLEIDADRTSAKADYQFDGDVRKSKANVRSFVHRDAIAWEVVVKKGAGPVRFEVPTIRLSTTELENTFGYSKVTLQATQGTRVLWTWSARAAQGKKSTADALPGKGSMNLGMGKLTVNGFSARVEPTFSGSTAAVAVVMLYEGSGQRT